MEYSSQPMKPTKTKAGKRTTAIALLCLRRTLIIRRASGFLGVSQSTSAQASLRMSRFAVLRLLALHRLMR